MGKWKARRTLLIVGEGHNEVAFLNHIKQLAAVRGQPNRFANATEHLH